MGFKRLPVVTKLFKEHSPKIAFRALSKMASIPSVWVADADFPQTQWDHAGCGTTDAALSFGGKIAPQNGAFEYNGTTWASCNNLNTGKFATSGCGTQDAGLSFAGETSGLDWSNITEEYNGTSWSTGGNLSTSRRRHAGCGTQDAGLCIGGNASSGDTASCEEYNGASWSAGGSLITENAYPGASGNQNAGLCMGGDSSATEEYNGSAWSAGGALSARHYGCEGIGSQSDSLATGGYNTGFIISPLCEQYDGDSWSIISELNEGRAYHGSAGTSNSGLVWCGSSPATLSTTEKYS